MTKHIPFWGFGYFVVIKKKSSFFENIKDWDPVFAGEFYNGIRTVEFRKPVSRFLEPLAKDERRAAYTRISTNDRQQIKMRERCYTVPPFISACSVVCQSTRKTISRDFRQGKSMRGSVL